MVFGYHQGTCRPHRTWNMFTLIGNALLNWWKVENNSTRKTEFICMRNPIKNEAGQKKEECSHTRLEENKKKKKIRAGRADAIPVSCCFRWSADLDAGVVAVDRWWEPEQMYWHGDLSPRPGGWSFLLRRVNRCPLIESEEMSTRRRQKRLLCRLAYCPWINNCAPSDKSRSGQDWR